MQHLKLFCFFPFGLWIQLIPGGCQSTSLPALQRDAYAVFEIARSENGLYRDSKVLNGNDYHPASSAAVGAGIIAEVIAYQEGWNAYSTTTDHILASLKTVTGHNPDLNFMTNASGYPLHWFNILTGDTLWKVEYSTIDAAILTAGALFAKEAFCENDSIVHYADLFWNSIDWSKAIDDPQSGSIYRLMKEDGEGIPGEVTLPFNEYMLVAWLAMNQANGHPDSAATLLWNNHYADPHHLPTISYQGTDLLTDHPDNFLSSFVPQFSYFYCNYFTTNTTYLDFLTQARLADSIWWAVNVPNNAYRWGLGAGHCPVDPGYCVCAVGDDSLQIYSPPIIAGFLPVYPEAAQDLLQLHESGEATFTLPVETQREVLWRRSLTQPAWISDQIQLIDFATMLFGITEHLRPGFFAQYNDFFGQNDCQPIVSVKEQTSDQAVVKLFPNPAQDFFSVSVTSSFRGAGHIRIKNSLGQVIYQERMVKREDVYATQIQPIHWPGGLYYLSLYSDGRLVSTTKFMLAPGH